MNLVPYQAKILPKDLKIYKTDSNVRFDSLDTLEFRPSADTIIFKVLPRLLCF